MRSDFDDFCGEGFDEASDVMGRESFTIAGVSKSFRGILNEFTCERTLDLGGKVGFYTATLLCALDDFLSVDELSGPLERALDGKRVMIDGRDYKIDRAAHDGIALTLGLVSPTKTK